MLNKSQKIILTLITALGLIAVAKPIDVQAAISHISSTTCETSDDGNGTYVLTLPTTQQNDLVIVTVGTADNDNVNEDVGPNLVGTYGYTEVADLFIDDGFDANLGVFWKIMGATPDTSYTLDSIGGNDAANVAICMVFRGVDTTTPLDVTTTTATGLSSFTPDPPSIDHNNPSGVWTVIAGVAAHNLGTGSFTFPTGYTTDANDRVHDDTSDATVGMGYRSSGVSDPENPAVMTHSGTTNANFSWAAATLALRPQAISVSGTVLSVSGGTETVCDANAGTNELSMRVGSTTYNTTCTDSTGAFTFSGVGTPSAGDGMVIWINDLATDGATVVRYDGAGNSTDNLLYESTVSVTSDDTNPVDVTDMDTYDSTGDADIPYTATAATSVSVISGFNLRVNLKSGVANGSSVFLPAGTVTLASPGTGSLHIDDNALATLDTATNSINGDILVDGGATLRINNTTNINGGDITTSGTSATVTTTSGTPSVLVSGTGSIGGGTTPTLTFHSLGNSSSGTITIANTTTINNNLNYTSTGTFIINAATTVTNDVSIGTGTLTVNANLSIDGGDLTTSSTGTINTSSGTPTVDIDGTGTLGGGSGSITIYNLDLGDGTTDTTTLSTTGVVISNGLTVNTSQTFSMGANSITVGSSSVTNSGGISVLGIISQTSSGTTTVRSSSGGSATIGGAGCTTTNCTFGNLTFGPAVASAPTFTLGSAASQVINVAGAMTIGNGTNPVTVNAETNDPTLNVDGNFVFAACSSCATTFSASSTGTFTVGGNWTNVSDGVFTANSGTVTMDATTGSPKTITSAGDAFNNLSIDNGGTAITWNLADALDVNGNLLLDTSNTLSTSTHAVNVAGNWANNGTYTASNTTTLDGAGGTTQVVTGDTTFSTLTVATSTTRVVQIEAGSFQTVSNITLTGTSCNAMLIFRSTVLADSFIVTNNDASPTVSYSDFQDAQVTTNTFSSGTGITDSGGNTGITFDNTCEGGSNSADASNYSFQRKTFKDEVNSVHWLAYHDGDEIEVNASLNNGSTWIPGNNISYDTNDFSIFDKTISATASAVIAVKSGDDIVVRRGNLGDEPSVSWESAVVALNGSGASDTYAHAYVSLDSDNYIWVLGRYFDGTNYVIRAAKSNNPVQSLWSAITFEDPVTLSDNQTSSNAYGNIVPLNNRDMYATFVAGTALEGCAWDHSDLAWEDSPGTGVCSVVSGGSGESEGSSTRATGNVKIDDSGDPGYNPWSARGIVQTSEGVLYSFINDGGSCEIYKSTDGSSWSQQGSGQGCNSTDLTVSIAIDSTDTIHAIYKNDGDNALNYISFATDIFGSEGTIDSDIGSTGEQFDIGIDSNDKPHVVYRDNSSILYSNWISGSWASPVTVNSGNTSSVSIVINEDDIPEVAYSVTSTSDLGAAVGNANNTTSFTTNNSIDTGTPGNPNPSILIDNEGNTWIAYAGQSTSNILTLIKHNDADAWSSWQSSVNNGNATGSTSLKAAISASIIGKTIFVIYEDDSTDSRVVYDAYDTGTANWSGETPLATPGASVDFRSISVRYANYNFHEPWLLDYTYSDGTDIYWNYIDLRPTKIDDASNFGALPSASRQVVRARNNNLYTVFFEGTNIEVWKSSDGYRWEEQDSANKPTLTNDASNGVAIGITSADVIQIAFSDELVTPGTDFLKYTTFTTSSDQWNGGSAASVETIVSGTNTNYTLFGLATDSSSIPHIVYKVGTNSINYLNRVGGTPWAGATVENVTANFASIAINASNIPELAYVNLFDNDLSSALGDGNDATAFTIHDIDDSVNATADQQGTSYAIDPLTGHSWISYVDASSNNITLARYTGDHTAGQWTGTHWKYVGDVSTLDTNNTGYEPSLAIAGSSKIYVLYEAQDTSPVNHADDIAYDVYDSINNEWAGETVLQAGTFQNVKAKWSFEWNNYGANRIDYLYSDGTDVYWDYLYVRRSPTNIDNASDFGTLPAAGRQVLRTSSGELYILVNDGGNCEVWRSGDGDSWAIQDSANDPACNSSMNSVVGAIDSTGIIHYSYIDDSTNNVNYIPFDTSNNQFGTEQTVETLGGNSTNYLGITIDSNDVPHVVFEHSITIEDLSTIYYDNRIGGIWGSLVTVEGNSATSMHHPDITINEDNIPEIAYINGVDDHLSAVVGNQNDATSFGTPQDIDTSADDTSDVRGASIAVDSSGNTWVSYVDSDGFLNLAKHLDASAWTSWETLIQTSQTAKEPSVAIYGSEIYVFYEDDQDNIVFDTYNGSTWSGETILEEHGALQDVKVRWSFLNNASYSTYGFDYIYSDGTDIFYNRLTTGGAEGTQDAIDTVPTGLTKTLSAVSDSTNYDVHLVFVDDESTDQIAYRRWDSGTTTWQSATLVPDATGANDAYPSISIDTNSRDLTTFWIDTSSNVISYAVCDVSAAASECSTASDWAAETSWKTGSTFSAITSSYGEANEVFAEWSVGSTHVTIDWDRIATAATTTFTLSNYRWFVDNDALDVGTNAWSAATGIDLAENTELTPLPVAYDPLDSTQEIRLRVSFTIGGANLSATAKQFKLQYKEATDSSCTAGDWTDLGGANAWTYATSGVSDGATIITTRLAASDVGGQYAKSAPTTLNANSATTTQDIEYDFHLIAGSAYSGAKRYLFRVVESGGTVFDTYTNCPALSTEPGTESLMRHGGFYTNYGEQGFWWAD